jgi:hypothetical protein
MIRKHISITLLLIISLGYFGYAQTPVKDTSSKYLDISIFGSPDYNYRMIAGNGENGVTSEMLNSFEEYRVGYSAGLMFTKNIKKWVSMEFGIIYQNYGYKTGSLMDTIFDHYNEMIYSRDYYKAVRYNAIDIPIMVKFQLFKVKKTEFSLALGVAPCFYIGKNTLKYFSTYVENDITKAERDVQVQGLFNLNVLIPLSKNLYLGIEPTLRYDILAMNDRINLGVKRNFYSPGLGITLTYRLFDDVMYDYYYQNIYNKDKDNKAGVIKIKY